MTPQGLSPALTFFNTVLVPRSTLSSRVPANALGPNTPAVNSVGNTGSNSGTFLLPLIGLVAGALAYGLNRGWWIEDGQGWKVGPTPPTEATS